MTDQHEGWTGPRMFYVNNDTDRPAHVWFPPEDGVDQMDFIEREGRQYWVTLDSATPNRNKAKQLAGPFDTWAQAEATFWLMRGDPP